MKTSKTGFMSMVMHVDKISLISLSHISLTMCWLTKSIKVGEFIFECCIVYRNRNMLSDRSIADLFMHLSRKWLQFLWLPNMWCSMSKTCTCFVGLSCLGCITSSRGLIRYNDPYYSSELHTHWLPWASCQIRKIAGCAYTGNAGNYWRVCLY